MVQASRPHHKHRIGIGSGIGIGIDLNVVAAAVTDADADADGESTISAGLLTSVRLDGGRRSATLDQDGQRKRPEGQ